MAYLAQLYADVRTVVAATWADVLPNGIWENEHLEMIPWADLTPPYAAICVDTTPLASDWGVANQTYTPTVGIYYVGIIAGDSVSMRSKMEALRDALLANTVPGTLTVLDVTGMTWSDDLAVNKIFQSKDYSHRAGRLQAQVLVGTQP